MRLWNRKHKPKHWTRAEWKPIMSLGEIEYYVLRTKLFKSPCKRFTVKQYNLKTNKAFRRRDYDGKVVSMSMPKLKEVE
ncbi:MAG: hypothetical protein KHZ27_01995 [Fusobacterium sp.]|nr:hypothetical protein [Fusobacterium sp.]